MSTNDIILFLWLSNIPLYISTTLLYPFYVSGHLGCFQVLFIANSAAINIVVHVSFWIMVSSGCILSSGTAGPYGSFIPSFLKNLNTVLHSHCYQFTFPSTGQEGSLLFTSSLAFIVCRFFDNGHSDWWEGIPHCILDLNFSNNEQCWESYYFFFSFVLYLCCFCAGYLKWWQEGACCGACISYWSGFSCCQAQALDMWVSVVVPHGP